MAAFPVFTTEDLAQFTGRPESSFTPYFDQTLEEAMLLLQIAANLSEWPDDERLAKAAKFAVLAMADSIGLSQPYAVAMAAPFISETIGSYSYSKGIKAVSNGDSTGIRWFDIAVNMLLGRGNNTNIVSSSSIRVFDKDEPVVVEDDGFKRLLGPSDLRNINDNDVHDPNQWVGY